ncbi:arylamine N-acetyltransferase [Kitasatospora kifunensis]|uniref:Amide synthase n=1 Tax=Kitasatospora kifunensis TaxID=58351 RepID=A0A7W7VXP8_KITKI|nr:arylamine N-acetyltransferase [Kitasatospora kifunensis]MBB4926862.1 amide synthase [Kitasatospora kifunensis]
MFDTDAYLRRIGCAGETGVDLDTLRRLHKHHLMAIPYNIAAQDFSEGVNLVALDEDEVFETAILGGRGGTCFQLNRLFFRLLGELGYEVSLLAGSTAEGWENFGTEIEHMFIRVTLDDEQWLVDVGYPGPSYLEPLLVSEAVQTQYGSQFRLVDKGDGDFALQRRGRVSRWSVVYLFKLLARQWDDWKALEDHARQNPAPAPEGDLQGVLYGRAFENGQVVLKGRRHLTVRDGRERVRTVVDDDEHRALATAIVSGDLP